MAKAHASQVLAEAIQDVQKERDALREERDRLRRTIEDIAAEMAPPRQRRPRRENHPYKRGDRGTWYGVLRSPDGKKIRRRLADDYRTSLALLRAEQERIDARARNLVASGRQHTASGEREP